MSRKPWDEYFLEIAEKVASRSTCSRAVVGCVIVRNKKILATGYNGSLPKEPHCDEEGHLIEDTHCITGDTIISKHQVKRYNSGHRTVKEIFDMWQDQHRRTGVKLMNIRTMAPNETIVGGKITDIWEVGKHETVTISTSLGRSITLTKNHLVYSPSGWKTVEHVYKHDRIAVNGQFLADDPHWLRNQYIDNDLTQVQIAKLDGRSRYVIKKRLERANIPPRPFKLGGWNKGMIGKESHSFKGEWKCPAAARGWASRNYKLDNCIACGSKKSLQIHHIDENPFNNNPENLLTLCIECHNISHSPHAKLKRIKWDKVTNILPAGNQVVYDLTTEPYHNFVGNGLILHNCIRTVHSESNAIAQAARSGISLEGSTLYCTVSPCWICFKLLAMAGIKRIVFAKEYRPDPKIAEHAARQKISWELKPLVKLEGK